MTAKTKASKATTQEFINSIQNWNDAKDGMTLVIVESPAKARTIQKFVDKDCFIIDSCAGGQGDRQHSVWILTVVIVCSIVGVQLA